MTKKKEKTDWAKVREEFIGKGKIQALKIDQKPNGNYVLLYRDNGKQEEIEAKDKRELDKLLIEFGGRNPETVLAPDKFLSLPGWTSEDLIEAGHKIQKIMLRGQRSVRNNYFPIEIPGSCGHPAILNSRRDPKNLIINFRQSDTELVDFTACFKEQGEFDNLLEFLTHESNLKHLSWHVHEINTYSVDTGSFCTWRKVSAGDGTKRMVLELQKLDGVHYQECIHYDLVAAADGLVGGECKKIPDKRKPPKDRLICEIYATSS